MKSNKRKQYKDLARVLNSNNDPVLRDYNYWVTDRSAKEGMPKLEIMLQHYSNGFSRRIHVVVPPSAAGNQNGIVVFMTDGQLVSGFAEWTFESLGDATLPPISFFGMECNDDGYKRRDRADEYLGADDEELFACHYEAFIKVLPSLAQHLLQVELARETSVVAGFSNGGAFAYRMAVKHPELFGNAVLMSPQRSRQPIDLSKLGDYKTKFFLIAGEVDLERLFKKNALRIKQALDDAGMENSFFHDATRGHNFFLWGRHFPTAINWLFNDSH